MGRKSKLTPEQWDDIARRHLLDKVAITALAKEYAVDESAIRRWLVKRKSDKPVLTPGLKEIAEEKVRADLSSRAVMDKIAQLPYPQQDIVKELADSMVKISQHLCSAAAYGAATAHRLSAIANSQLDQIDDSKPMASMKDLAAITLLTKMANSSSEIGVNLLRANKEAVEEALRGGKEKIPAGLGHFYPDDEEEAG